MERWKEEMTDSNTASLKSIAESLKQIADNTKQESLSERAAQEIMDLQLTIRNFGQELQHTLDNPPRNGLEMAQRMRELAARMSSWGIPPMFRGQ
jgi:hypothetical protein